MKIRTKLIIPTIIIITLFGLAAVYGITRMINADIEQQVEKASTDFYQTQEAESRIRITEINSFIDQISHKALEETALFIGNSAVIDAYILANKGNIDDENDPQCQQARMQLRQYFQPIIAQFKKQTGAAALKLHFHLPNGRSLVRLWRDGWQTKRNGKKIDISDDISSFRQTVMEINQGDHHPINGIEVGRGGFAIRGLAPIDDGHGNHLGSGEMLYSMDILLKTINTDPLVRYAVYMDNRLLPIATKLQNSQKYPVIFNRYVQTALVGSNLKLKDISVDLLDKGHRKSTFILKGNDYLSAFPIPDYSGKTVGVMVIIKDVSAQLKQIAEIEKNGQAAITAIRRVLLIGMAVIIVLLISGQLLLVSKLVTSPLGRAVVFCQKMGKGDLSSSLTEAESRSAKGDELSDISWALKELKDNLLERARLVKQVGDGDLTSRIEILSDHDILGQAMDKMVKDLSTMVKGINRNCQQLIDSSRQISEVSTGLAASSEEISSQTSTIAGATEEINVNTANVAETTREISEAMQSAAGATEEMSTSVSEIGGQAEEGRLITQTAMEQTTTATESVHNLNQAAGEISEVTKVIRDISDQTKLLALNATIEAARAGEAGKGFAVVASEVKELARQTSEATDNIAGRINLVQQGTDQVVQIIGDVTEVVNRVNDSSGLISSSIKEQIGVAGEIAEAVSHANVGSQTILSALDELNSGTTDVSANIQGVNQGMAENDQEIIKVSNAAKELASLADDLKKIISRFRLQE